MPAGSTRLLGLLIIRGNEPTEPEAQRCETVVLAEGDAAAVHVLSPGYQILLHQPRFVQLHKALMLKA